ncbi:HlyD family efflux transporter periplasmic adaptor subunit, partial [Streptomyces sp. NPDC002920]
QQQLGQLQQAVSSAQETLLTTQNPQTGTEGSPQESTSPSSGPSATDQQVHALQLASARRSLTMANAALSTFQATYGTKVPAGEVVFFPKLPARLDKVTVKAGDAPSGPIGTVTSSDLIVEATVPGSDAELLRRGMSVAVTTADGEKVRGEVDAIGSDAAPATGSTGDESAATDTSDTGETDDSGDTADTADPAGTGGGSGPVQLRIAVPEPGPLAGQADAAVRVTIEVGASDGKVLAVPIAAIHTSSDGEARVQVERNGGVRDVSVTVGLAAAGLVEVKAPGGTLKEGDRVVIGR